MELWNFGVMCNWVMEYQELRNKNNEKNKMRRIRTISFEESLRLNNQNK